MSGNGPDMGAIHQAVLAVSAEVRATKDEVAQRRTDMGHLRADTADELKRLRADMADAFNRLRVEAAEQFVRLRQTVVGYHSAVIGHGVLVSELDGRLRRVEQPLGLSPAA